MKMQKLLSMAPAEIAMRGRQALQKTAERVARGSRNSDQQVHDLFSTMKEVPNQYQCAASLYHQGDTEAAMDSLQATFRATAQQNFFVGTTDAQSPGLTGNYLARTRQEIIASAEAVCAGEYLTLGYGRQCFHAQDSADSKKQSSINWHLDAISGTSSPVLHWSRINALDFKQVGDSKVVWELNRHQWLVQLGLAWQQTGDERYASEMCQRMQSWMQQNPPGIGINWSSSLEVSYRLISWCWALVLFRNSTTVSAEFLTRMVSWVKIHADHIERYLSTYYSPNTHLTGESLGLYYAASLFPYIGGADRWRALGRRNLLEQLDRQVFDDGVYFEQSTRYQHYTVEIYLQFLILAQRNGDALPESVAARIEAMMDFLLNLRRPDGTLPQIGDTDGGALLTIVHREAGDFQALFAIAAAVFEREDFAWAAGNSTVELMCLLGPAGHYRFMALKQKAPPVVESRFFADGGYLIMRDSWRRRGHQLIFDAGPLGCEDSAAHGHADLLSIQCSAFGDNYLIDAGTGNYTADPYWRNYFRSSAAHNTVTVDGLSQMTPKGPFSWHGRRPRTCLRNCWTTPNLSLIDASHDAWSDLHDPVIHRRRVIFVRRSYWVVIDDLNASATHDYDLRFQFAPIAVRAERSGWIRAAGEGGSCLLMHISTEQSLDLTIVIGRQSPPAGWISANYGQRSPAPTVIAKTRSTGPARFITVLYPQPDASALPPDLLVSRSVLDRQQDGLRIQIDDNHSDRILITNDDIHVNQGASLCVE